MKAISEIRSITRPAADICAYLVDMRNFPAWIPGLSGFAPPDSPASIGKAIKFRVNCVSMTCTFVALQPARQVAYTLDLALGQIDVTIDLEEVDVGNTRLTKGQMGLPNWLRRAAKPDP